MDRPGLLALLAALVDAARLSATEARALVTSWDAGTLTDADLPAGPLVGTALAAVFTAAVRLAPRRIAAAYARLRGLPVPTAAQVPPVARAVDALPLRARLAVLDATRADDVRGALSREAARRTRVLYAGRDAATFGPGKAGSAARSAGEVSRWQRAMQAAYAKDAATLARLGAGRDLTAAQVRRLASVVADRAVYVDRFAVHLAQSAAGQAKVLSEAQVSAALVRRSAPARALFFELATSREADGMASPVGYYIPQDTPATCSPCSDAGRGSPYLLADLPMPSTLCLGGGACRCEIRVEDDAAAYARLSLAA